MIYKATVKVTMTDESGNKIVDLAEDKYFDSEMVEALKKEDNYMKEWLYEDYKNVREKNSELLNEVARLTKENAELKDDIEWYREKCLEEKAIIQFFEGLVKSQIKAPLGK